MDVDSIVRESLALVPVWRGRHDEENGLWRGEELVEGARLEVASRRRRRIDIVLARDARLSTPAQEPASPSFQRSFAQQHLGHQASSFFHRGSLGTERIRFDLLTIFVHLCLCLVTKPPWFSNTKSLKLPEGLPSKTLVRSSIERGGDACRWPRAYVSAFDREAFALHKPDKRTR